MDEQVNPLERDHFLSVVLPGGTEKNATVHGSKPVMDLLVTLCASYHLNPSDYTVEVLSPNKNNISFKPNSPIGSLEAEKIVLKPRGVEEKIRRPYMPEASVRLLINYYKSHKAVVRVSPRVPLEMLLPVVCDKCEFNTETTVLLRDSQSREPLDLTKTLNELGLREVFAKDTAEHRHQAKTPEAAVTPTEAISPPPLQGLPKREKKQRENTGFLSLFRKGKKKPQMEGAVSPPTSPGLNKPLGVGVNGQDVSSSTNTTADMPKKRRAPQPPMGASQSVPNNLSTCHLRGPQRSGESTLRSTKRRAPPPPCANIHQELQADPEVKGTIDSMNTVEELRESDESDSVNSLPSSSSPHPSQPWSSSFSSRPSLAHLHQIADPYLPSFRGKDLSDARCALAKVLTSSVSKGTLVKRLRNSATFPKLHNGSSFMSMTQRCSDNGVLGAEPEPVLTSNLPTEPEWEDPAQRKGMTTFKVVPSKTQKSHDPELTLDVPDQITIEDNPESKGFPELQKTKSEEDPCSPDRSKTETTEPSSQENQASDWPDSLPPPPDIDNLDCPGSPLSEVGDTFEKQKEEDEAEITSEVIPAAPSDCSDGPIRVHQSAELPSDGQITSEDQRGELASDGQITSENQRGKLASDGQINSEDQRGELPSDDRINSEDQSGEFPSDGRISSEDPSAELPGDGQISSEDQSGEPVVASSCQMSSEDQSGELASDDQINSEEQSGEFPSDGRISSEDPSAELPGDGQISSEDQSGEPVVASSCQMSSEDQSGELASGGQISSEDQSGELASDGQINSEDQSEFLQSPCRQSVSVDLDHCGSCTDEREADVVQEEDEAEEDSFPPPPPPVFFDENIEDETEDTASSLPPSPTFSGETNAFSEDHQNKPTSATLDQSAAAPKPLDKWSTAPSRFAQAVAMAVQRSRLQSRGKSLGPQAPTGPHNTLPSPPRSIYQFGA